jgi:hypothetical protein
MRRVATAVALLACAGCGKSKEQERLETVRRICEGFAPGATTLQGAFVALEGGQLGTGFGGCTGGLVAWGAGDACDYAGQVCTWDVSYLANDPGVCSPSGCYYGCLVRANAAASADGTDLAAPLCARRFYPPQGTPVILPP